MSLTFQYHLFAQTPGLSPQNTSLENVTPNERYRYIVVPEEIVVVEENSPAMPLQPMPLQVEMRRVQSVATESGVWQRPNAVQDFAQVGPPGRGGNVVQGATQVGPPGRGGNVAQGAAQVGPPGRGPNAQGGQPGGLNPNQAAQMVARLRAMDANGNGVLESNEIPANQRERVNAIITQLGGNPNSQQINLNNLERRAVNNAQQANNANQQGANQQADEGRQRQRPEERQRQPEIDPLVRPFGETRPADRPVLAFGQRDSLQNSTADGRRQTADGRRQTPENRRPAGELVAVTRSQTARQSAVYDNIPATVRNNTSFSWFFDYDTDQDGQLTMLEYVNGRGGDWTDGIVVEFLSLDRNRDGFITMEEALATIREWDERRTVEERDREPARTVQGNSANPRPPFVSGASPAVSNRGSGNSPNAAGWQGGQRAGRGANQSGTNAVPGAGREQERARDGNQPSNRRSQGR